MLFTRYLYFYSVILVLFYLFLPFSRLKLLLSMLSSLTLGNQLHDIARILYMFCDAEVRREAEHTLIEDYFKTLVEHTKNNGQIVEFGTGQASER